jgi:signal transduction histidine kinase/CheY-like chemotaxis protein
LRYANQTLLELADTCSNSVANYPDLGTLLEAIGLPLDLLTKCDVAPHQIAMQTPYEGLRHYLVERKLALEISDPDGTVSLSALLFTDITRAERAREALKSAEERARHLALLKSSFLANMSHEIRTPMNGILGMVQLLQTTSTDDEQKRYIEIIKCSGDIMLKVINDILDLSKMEAGHVQLEEAPFDLTQLIEGVVDMLRPRALEKSVRISAVFDATDPLWLLGDAFRLRQVLLNIAGNAVKFTSKGEVQIRVHDDPHTRHAQLLMISVSDTGIGIPEDQLSQVFEKFHQADPSTTRKHGGTGLGLSISKELVSLMGGTIGLVSTVRVGSTFTISLPLVKANPPNASHAPALQTTRSHFAPGAGRRILVAEDDSTNQVVIETILKSKGFEVEIASSGQRVLDLLDDHGCDLILMDCQMPGLDGYQTTARIRAIEGVHRHTPIIALTAHALPEDRQRCLNAGMDDYLAKPIDILALWQALRKWNCLSALPAE